MFLPARTRSDGYGYYKKVRDIDRLVSYGWGEENEHSKTQVEFFGSNYLDVTDRRKAVKQIKTVQKIYNKSSGRRMCHYVLSFDSMIRDADAVKELACAVMWEFFPEYQMLYAVHINTDNLHIHFIFNPVNIETGKKFSLKNADFHKLQNNIETYAIEFLKSKGIISVADNSRYKTVPMKELLSGM